MSEAGPVGMEKYIAEEGAVLNYEGYLNHKYGSRVQESELKEGEGASEFKDRLEGMYPEDRQRAYIETMFTVNKLAHLGSAYLGWHKSGFFPENVTDLAREYFKGSGREDLELSEKGRAELLYACNSAIIEIETHVKRKIEEIKVLAKEHYRTYGHLGEKPNLPSRLRSVIGDTLGAVAGIDVDEFKEEMVDEALIRAVTPEEIFPRLVLLLNKLENIREGVRDNADPIGYHVSTTELSVYSDELDVLVSGSDISNSWLTQLKKQETY